MREKLLIILVIYNKDINSIDLLKNQDYDFFVYDNSRESQVNNFKVKYVHNSSNIGVSAAYNAGIKYARELGKRYILLLDQDTNFKLTILYEYQKMIEKYGDGYIYSPILYGDKRIYSPYNIEKYRGTSIKDSDFEYSEIYSLKKQSIINSGMLIPLKVIDAVGFFNPDIKLDFSDTYYMTRYKEVNRNIILINTRVKHELSADEEKDCSRELNRFKFYCNGAKALKESLKLGNEIILQAFYRAIKLVVRHRKLSPFIIFKDFCIGDEKI